MIKTIAYSSVAFITPRILTFLCTRPTVTEGGLSAKVRHLFTNMSEGTLGKISPKARFFMTDVLADNAWISVLVLRSLLRDQDRILDSECVVGFAAFSSLSWGIRFGLAKAFPSLDPYIGPRNLAP